jgi:hypothetical protein
MKQWVHLAMFALTTTCAPTKLPEPRVTEATPRARPARVVIVAIDGVRPRDVFEGERELPNGPVTSPSERVLPHLTELGNQGLRKGTQNDLVASGPNYVSLPGYTEILTGRKATCFENDCNDLSFPTIADDLKSAGARTKDVAIVTSWDRIGAVAALDPSRIVLATGSKIRENAGALRISASAGRCAEPGHGDYQPDHVTMQIAEAYFEEHKPKFMFVSLGDTDEYAHRDDFRGYWRALSAADAFVGRLRQIAARAGEEVAFFVTTDHGRSLNFKDHGREHPESAAVWLIAGGVEASSFGAPETIRNLSDIAPVARNLLGVMPADPKLHARGVVAAAQ